MRLFGGVVALALLPMASAPVAGGVRWVNGAEEELEPLGRAELTARLRTFAAVAEERRHVIVRFAGPIDAERRATLAGHGLVLLDPLGDSTWFAAIDRRTDAAGAAGVPGFVAVERIVAGRKLHPDLARGIVHPWAAVDAPDKGDKLDDAAAEAAEPSVAVYVVFHADVTLESEGRSTIAAHGGTVRSLLRSIRGAVVHLPTNAVHPLAAADAVMWVEPPLPPWRELNDGNRARVGAEVAQQEPYGLSGAGVDVLVYDAGTMFPHGDFAGRLTIGPSDTSVISDHATHVGGTIGGSGAGSTFDQYRGMAPGVRFISYGFEQQGGLSQGFLYTDPGDLEADYAEAIVQLGADIANNSIGTNTAVNGFPCDWEGDYGVTDALIDAIARGSLGAPFRIVFANGNERATGVCGTSFHTTAPPACAKNHITVGALDSNDDSITGFTSWGPCDDGRLKPDVSAPGCQSTADHGVTSTDSLGDYNVKCGTSMASPTACGVSALVIERYRASLPERPDPRNATLKAILANTAFDLDTPGPDYKSGYGSIRALPAAELVAGARVIEEEVAQGETWAFLVLVDAGAPELRVTLAWDDPPGTPNVAPVLVNDLDLRVIDQQGGVHWPWTLDPHSPASPAVRDQPDRTNNIEQVFIEAPAPGAYRVEVTGFAIAQGATQPFGVAATPTLVPCSPEGVLSTDRARVTCSGEVGLHVIDCDLDIDDATVETVPVTVNGPSEPEGETLALVESAPDSAAFLAALPVDTSDAPGVLRVAHGETLIATYVDADDGQGGFGIPVTRQVVVDCLAPAILAVSVVEVDPREALIRVELDEPARVATSYGTDCAAPAGVLSSAALSAVHEVRLTGLDDDTTYAVSIAATDEAGNETTDDNGGGCYGFTTPEVPDFFTEPFSLGIDLDGTAITFTPNGSLDHYAACAEPLPRGLPTDPTGGAPIMLADDESMMLAIGGGERVWLYGVAYDAVHVGSNGYVTFGQGDATHTESLTRHFAIPRVAALFDDLDPGAGGTVSWRQLPDRIAVSWVGVPERDTSNSNTFQVELFFDSRIRLSWAELAATDAIAGLSAGTGLDAEYLATDLSAAGACGPRPPVAFAQSLATDVGGSLEVTLAAVDDGLPEPAALAYRIVSLPALGSLADAASGQPIESVAFELDPLDPRVVYTAVPGYRGLDSFLFVADDGGPPPDGGQSLPAAVVVLVGGPQPIHEFLVDDTSPPGWVVTGEWSFGQPAGGGSHGGDPTSGATGLNVFGYDLGGDYSNDMPEEWLTTPPLDLSGATDTVLEFQRWLAVESADHAALWISTDGGVWTPLWQHSGSSFNDHAWRRQSYDISAIADGEPRVAFRWVMGETDGSVTFPGWNVDDVRVLGVTEAACTAAPGETPALRFIDRETLRWGLTPFYGGTEPVHDVLRSVDPRDFSSATCVAAGVSGSTATDAEPVPAGGSRFYLVRGRNGCGSGLAGQGSDGEPHVAPACSP